jgi:peptidoglycan/xylan/chitin deacetylase (PgdA/CDA1 family)
VKRWSAIVAAGICGMVIWLMPNDDGKQKPAATPTPTPAVTPLPAPEVTLTSAEGKRWAPLPPDRSAIPVVLYHGVGPEEDYANAADAESGVDRDTFAEQLTLMKHAGYRTVKLETLIDFLRGKAVDLPARPLLITFDDGRVDSWTGADAILDALGYTAVLFVDVGTVDDGKNREYLTWPQLQTMDASGRWDLQLHSGHGHTFIKDADGKRAPFYSAQEDGESFAEWQQRVHADVEWGQDTLAEHIPRYEPLAFSPPFGDYGQSDPKLGDDFLGWLEGRYAAIFTQDENARAKDGARQPLGRIPIARATQTDDLPQMLQSGEQR